MESELPSRLQSRLQGEVLRELKPDPILLQEVNLGSVETLRQAAEADWLVRAADPRQRAADDRPVRPAALLSLAAARSRSVPGSRRTCHCPSGSCWSGPLRKGSS